MTVRSHYEVLGVDPQATSQQIREAYRRLARLHHPDRVGSAAGGSDAMHAINEAYRVLNDPGRRALYDSSLGATPDPSASPPSSRSAPATSTPREFFEPARVPWRGLALAGTIAIAGIFVVAQFTEPGTPRPPDGILRIADCVEIEPDNDAREIACTGEQDLVVRALVAFDATCPNGTEPHRDRQGMGVACIERPR